MAAFPKIFGSSLASWELIKRIARFKAHKLEALLISTLETSYPWATIERNNLWNYGKDGKGLGFRDRILEINFLVRFTWTMYTIYLYRILGTCCFPMNMFQQRTKKHGFCECICVQERLTRWAPKGSGNSMIRKMILTWQGWQKRMQKMAFDNPNEVGISLFMIQSSSPCCVSSTFFSMKIRTYRWYLSKGQAFKTVAQPCAKEGKRFMFSVRLKIGCFF